MQTRSTLWDHAGGYGSVSRSLHWLMALFFVWQFISVTLRVLADETPPADFFWSTHYSVGFTLWVLVLLRGSWGLLNYTRRPAHEGPWLLRRAATIGHGVLYLLMIVVPSLAIARAAGNGRGLSVYGIQLVAPGGDPNPTLTGPANAVHGLLGWTLFTLIAGHIVIALIHAFVLRDGTLRRMTKGAAERRA